MAQYVQLREDGSIDVDFGTAKTYAGVWKFQLQVESVKSTVESERAATFEFSMTLLDRCVKDELTKEELIKDFDYYMGVTGELVV